MELNNLLNNNYICFLTNRNLSIIILKIQVRKRISLKKKSHFKTFIIIVLKMNKTISVLKRDLGGLRAGRANPQLLERILVDYYGAMTPINQMAAIFSDAFGTTISDECTPAIMKVLRR